MAMLLQSEFERTVAAALRDAKLKVEVQPHMGGLRPDFLVTTPSGRRVVVEVKGWAMDDVSKARAIRQVSRYAEATGADQVYLVVPHRPASWNARNVLSLDGLLGRLRGLDTKGPSPQIKAKGTTFRKTRERKERSITVFAAMPFAPEFDDVYLVAMAGAAKSNDVTCVRVDHEPFEGDVVDRIQTLVKQSAVTIADLSDAKPNVMFEAGYAHGLGKPVIPICSTPLSELPFDVRNWNTILYRKGSTSKLIEPLTIRLREALSGRSS